MSTNPPKRAALSVFVVLRNPLDSEAYAARLQHEPGFRARLKWPESSTVDVALSDRCHQAWDPPPDLRPNASVVLVDPLDGAPAGPPCACCRRISRSTTWPRLVEAIAHAAGRTVAGGGTERAGSLGALTRRELDVLRLVGLGKSVAECADELGVANSTIGNHKYRLMKKLGATTSLQLLRIAVRHGLADFEQA